MSLRPNLTQRVVPVSMGPHGFAIPAHRVLGVTRGNIVSADATAPMGCIGRADDDAYPVHVWSLARLLGLCEPEQRGAMVIVQTDDGAKGLQVSGVQRPIDIAADHWTKLPSCFGPAATQLTPNLLLPPSNDSTDAIWPVVDLDGLWSAHLPDLPPARATELPTLDPKASSRSGQIIVFHPAQHKFAPNQLMGFALALSIAQVIEVAHVLVPHAIPFTPSHVSGVARWRERALPVLRLEKFLGDESPPLDGQGIRCLIARTSNEELVAIATSGGFRSLRLPIASQPVAAPRGCQSWHLASFQTEHGTLVVPDLQRLTSGALAAL
jgi:hypothetical protein